MVVVGGGGFRICKHGDFLFKTSEADGKSEGIIAFLAPGSVSCKRVNWWWMSDPLIHISQLSPRLRCSTVVGGGEGTKRKRGSSPNS